MQSLIKDHYQYRHKNLLNTYDWVPFNIVEISLKGLIHTYLPMEKVKTYIHLAGSLDYSKSIEERESALIYLPVFYRIMNNLIKNMAEANSDEVHFYFDYNADGFFIETKNRINNEQDLKKLSEKLSQIILDEKDQRSGLGLESIHHLAIECGGKFDFEISSDIWVNRIHLPINKSSKKAA